MTNANRIEAYHAAIASWDEPEMTRLLGEIVSAGRSDWRDVKTELPADSRECFVWMGEAGEGVARHYGGGAWSSSGIPLAGVTHWQPVVFPDPPQ